MRKIITTLIMIAHLSSSAQFLPMLEEGKVWVCREDVPVNPNFEPIYFKYIVGADTIINNIPARKIYSTIDDRLVLRAFAYEQGGILYAQYNKTNECVPLLNFNITKGCEVGDGLVVVDEQVAQIRGVERRVLKMTRYGNITTYWIEGIGTTDGEFLENAPMPGGHVVHLQECYVGDKLLYSREDLEEIEYGKVEEITTGPTTVDSKLYDLLGRPVSSPRKGHIYVKSSNKVLWKD